MLDAEDRAVELGLFGILQALDLFLALFLNQLLNVFGVFADPVDQARALAPITAVFFRHYSPLTFPIANVLGRDVLCRIKRL